VKKKKSRASVTCHHAARSGHYPYEHQMP